MDREFRYLCLADFVNRVNTKFGSSLSYQIVHKRIQAGAIPAIRVGPIYVLHEDQIDRTGKLFRLKPPVTTAEPAEPPLAAVADTPETHIVA